MLLLYLVRLLLVLVRLLLPGPDPGGLKME